MRMDEIKKAYPVETGEVTNTRPDALLTTNNDWILLYEYGRLPDKHSDRLFGRGERILTEYDLLDRSLGYD